MKSAKNTKASGLTQEMKAAAVTNPDGALCFMFLSAFGQTLLTLTKVVDRIIADQDVKIVYLAATAGVQIRNNAVFVGTGYGTIGTKYPELVITGERGVTDGFNFGALHALGHLLGHVSTVQSAKMMLNKAGSCVTGEGVTDSEAGKINKEISDSWTQEDKALFSNWRGANTAAYSAVLDPMFDSMAGKASGFMRKAPLAVKAAAVT